MSPQFESSHNVTGNINPGGRTGFSLQEQKELLSLAHEAILSKLEGREILAPAASSRFNKPQGAFTTLYLHGRLRGCVGYALAVAPLRRTIVETARGAAFEDPRFPPVTLIEARELKVSLSILSALQSISPEEIVIGKHGLVMSHNGRRGLLLPQVPIEQEWDRYRFLDETCRKAGLSPDAWKLGATIEAFTADVFGDKPDVSEDQFLQDKEKIVDKDNF